VADGPWTQYQQAPAEDGPWKKYAVPKKEPPTAEKVARGIGAVAANPEVGAAETGLSLALGALSLPVAAGASLYQLATAPAGEKAKRAAEASQGVTEAMTYEPRTEAGKALTGAAAKVLGLPGELGEYAQEKVGKALAGKVSVGTEEAARATVRMIPEVVATVAGARAGEGLGKGSAAAGRAVTGEARAAASASLDAAKDFVTNKLGIKWDEVPPGLRKKLQTVARDPQELAKLDRDTVEREARAERLGYPITRGDAARNLGQQSREDVIKKAGDENPIRDIRTAQDLALHGAVDQVRKSTGATAKTHEQIGQSVQDEGIRTKAKASKAAYNAAFDKARETEPNATVSADPLYEALSKNPDIQELGFVERWLKKAKIEQKGAGPGGPIQLSTDIGKALKSKAKGAAEEIGRRPISLDELQNLREHAGEVARSGRGSEKYVAGKLVKAIDQSFEKIPPAAKAWKEARDLYDAHQKEFEKTGINKALGSNKPKSTDRRVDVEKTVAKVMRSSKEDIGKLKKTLTTGGTDATRTAGTRAWRNIQAGVLDELKEAAKGKRKIPGEKGQPQFQSTFLDLFNKLEANGKIDVIFDKAQAAKLREIAKAVQDVRTKSNVGISGSDTATNLAAQNTLSKLEKLSLVPFGKTLAGAAKIGQSILKAGQTERELAHAKTTPVTEAATKAKSSRSASHQSATRRKNTLRTLGRVARASPLTLRERDEQNHQNE
jgi:hypothetical protein